MGTGSLGSTFFVWTGTTTTLVDRFKGNSCSTTVGRVGFGTMIGGVTDEDDDDEDDEGETFFAVDKLRSITFKSKSNEIK